MTQPRFSMNSYKPLTLDQKKAVIDAELYEIQEKRQPLVDRKQEIETELSVLNNRVRVNGNLPDLEFREICEIQDRLKAEKRQIDSMLLAYKTDLSKKNRERDAITTQIKYSPKEFIEERLVELRDKYTQFAADKTRVASMRAMAAELVNEINILLK